MYPKAQQALDKAKVHLMTKSGSIFLSNLSMQLEHIIDDSVPTACTNGKYIKYNPTFLLELSKEQRLGLLAHEIWHVAFNHMFRRGSRDPKIWGASADYVINALLINSKYELPPDGLYDPMFTGWSTEQVYEYLLKIPSSLDYPEDLIYGDSDEELEQEVTNKVLKAVQRTLLTDPGSIPQEISTSLQELINPKLNWKELLYHYISERMKVDVSWNRPNKKYLPEFFLPNKDSLSTLKLTVAIDTSGSLFDDLGKEILPELEYLNQSFQFSQLTILGCDTEIHNIYEINSNDDIQDLVFTGNGGTSVEPILEYIQNNHTNLVIYFTDGEMMLNLEEPHCTFIWVIYNNEKFKAPFGYTIFID